MQQFFTNTIESKFIKSLIKSTPIPRLPVAVGNQRLVKGRRYIYQNNIIECTQSGTLWDAYNEPILASDSILVSDSLKLHSGFVTAKYKIIKPYVFGDDDISLCEKFVSKSDYYDPDTHYFLGQYLRCMRNSYGIDLMPFYNCYNGTTASDFYLDEASPVGYYQSGDKAYRLRTKNMYKTIMVPIKFDTTYTVAINCSSPVLIKSVIHGNLGMLAASFSQGRTGIVTNVMKEDSGNVLNKSIRTDFNRPFLYSISSACGSQEQGIDENTICEYERYLYLVIQLPSDNHSSIVVLEGDYTDCDAEKTFNIEDIEKVSPQQLNSVLLTQLSLLNYDDGKNYAFSDRLIEYLLLNVIDSIDPIWQNIERVRKYTGIESKIGGVWDNTLRAEIFNRYMADKKTDEMDKIDINGFVDKNIERFITRGLEV